MNFLNPFVLFGLFAASIPIILHLLNLRKLKSIEFSTLRFLKELQKTKIKRLKLKQIILLILRTLIIIFAVLAFARPTIKSSLPVMGTYAKSSVIILLDNSFSMDVSDEFGNRFKQSKSITSTLLDGLKDGDEAVIIPIAGSDGSNPQFMRNISLIRQELSKIKIANTSANLDKYIRVAANLMDDASHLNKEVFIITDAQHNIFYNEIKDSLKIFNSSTVVYFLPIGIKSKAEIQNISIDSVNVVNRIFQIDKLVEAEAIIRNNSDKDVKGVVVSMFFNEERVAQRSIDIPANETRSLSIAAAPKSYGVVKARIELEEDALNIDNHRYFGFNIPQRPTVALIGSSNKTNFISLALGAKSNGEGLANIQTFAPSQISSLNLTNYDLLICAGGTYTKSDFLRISQYVRTGGSCLIFANEETDYGLFKEGIASLGINLNNTVSYTNGQAGGFLNVDKIHPLFEGVFKGTTDNKAIVESPKIYKAFPASGGQSLIDIAGGSFLTESRLDEGKILYCAVTPTIDWSSFPITGIFPTIIYRSTIYLSAKEGLGKNVVVGTSLMLSLPKKFASAGNFKVTDPLGNMSYKQAVVLPANAVVDLDYLNIPGIYQISTTQDKLVALISVNVPSSESSIKSATEKEISQFVKSRLNEKTNFKIIDDTMNINQSLTRARLGTELWQLFIVLALLCVIAEMLVARNTKAETIEN